MRQARVGLLVLGSLAAVTRADHVADAATAALAAAQAGDHASLSALAARSEPDPWLVAHELCVRGSPEAALAFAKASPRPATDKLPDYVVSLTGAKLTRAAEVAFVEAQKAVIEGRSEEALRTIDAAPAEPGTWPIRLAFLRGLALGQLRRTEEAVAALGKAAEAAEGIGWHARAAMAWLQAGHTAFVSSLYADALPAYERALAAAEKVGDPAQVAGALVMLGNTRVNMGNGRDAVAPLRRAVAMWEGIGNRLEHARALGNLAMALEGAGETREALATYERTLALMEELKDKQGIALTLDKLGGIRFLSGEPEKALELYERAQQVMRSPHTLANMARVHTAQGRLDRAVALLEQAVAELEAEGDLRNTATALVSLGLARQMRGDFPAAFRHYERALSIQRRVGARGGEADTLMTIATAHAERGDHPAALAAYEQSLEIVRETGRPQKIALVLGNMAIVHKERGDFRRALAMFREARVLFLRVGDRPGAARMLGNIGAVHDSLGEYTEALRLFEEAMSEYEGMGLQGDVASVLHNIGMVHFHFGDPATALGFFERQVAIAEASGEVRQIAMGLSDLALAQTELARHDDAEATLKRALALVRDHGFADLAARVMSHLGNACERRGEYAEAARHFQAAFELHENQGDRWGAAMALASVATVARRAEDPERAAAVAAEAVARAEELDSPRVLGSALEGLAWADLQRGRARDALKSARRGVDVAASLVGGLDERRGAQAREVWAGCFEVGLRAARVEGDVEQACFFLEAGRAGALLESLGGRERLRADLVPAALYEAEAKARAAENVVSKDYAAALKAGDRAAIGRARQALDGARSETESAVARVQVEAKAAADIVYTKVRSLPEIQAALEEGEALVLYALLRPRALALVVTRKSARAVELGPTDDIVAACRAISTPNATAARRLAACLVDPLRLGPDTSRLLIAPHGVLAYVPFVLVCGGRDVACVPSATTHLLLRETGVGRGEGVLALGDPASPKGALPAARKEAQAVGDVVLLGADASETGLAAALAARPRWRAVHVACHGAFDPARPMRTSLALAPDAQHDGELTLLEIFRLKAPADLVVLSACETAKGEVFAAEGVMGLVRAFMLAGSTRVIVSLWDVDDEATATLMRKFYELWNPRDGKGLPAATALRRAQEFVASHEAWKDPRFWAAWQLWE